MDASLLSSADQPMPVSLSQPFTCTTCNYSTFIKGQYKQHLLSKKHNHIEKPETIEQYSCEKCKYHTSLKQRWNLHLESNKHNQEIKPTNICELCNYQSDNSYLMKQHMNNKLHQKLGMSKPYNYELLNINPDILSKKINANGSRLCILHAIHLINTKFYFLHISGENAYVYTTQWNKSHLVFLLTIYEFWEQKCLPLFTEENKRKYLDEMSIRPITEDEIKMYIMKIK